jgi:hypothetical protein
LIWHYLLIGLKTLNIIIYVIFKADFSIQPNKESHWLKIKKSRAYAKILWNYKIVNLFMKNPIKLWNIKLNYEIVWVQLLKGVMPLNSYPRSNQTSDDGIVCHSKYIFSQSIVLFETLNRVTTWFLYKMILLNSSESSLLYLISSLF